MYKGRYDISRAVPEVRQDFLDSFDMGEYAPFVEGLVYFKGKKGDRAIDTNSVPGDLTSMIRVSDFAFRAYSWNEFYSVLVSHEGLHAQQNNLERNLPEGKVVEVIFHNGDNLICSMKDIGQEIRAHQNQIEDPSFVKCSPRFQRCVNNWLKFYENLSCIYSELVA